MVTDSLNKIIQNYTLQNHDVVAGPDWPSFESIKAGQDIPDFVAKELLDMLGPQNIKYCEFYITNVCNYDCSECRSFNNFDFKGHYQFDKYLYSEWAKKIKLESIVILGGEPLLHPDLKSWLEGVRSLWPDASAKIDTNGSYISKIKGLHELLVNNNFFLCINLHNPSQKTKLFQDIKTSFGQCRPIEPIEIESRTKGHVVDGECFISELGLIINVRPADTFTRHIGGSVDWQKLQNKNADVSCIYKGDAEQNHKNCVSAYCHVMLEGKIYKCSTMATLPVFLAQKKLHWPDQLLYQYEPLTLENYSLEKYNKFLTAIPQCTYCDTSSATVDISSSGIKKKQNRIIPIKTVI